MYDEMKSNRSIGVLIILYAGVVVLFILSLVLMATVSEGVGVVVCGLAVIAFIAYIIYGFIYNSKWVEDINTLCEGDGLHTPGLAKRGLFGILTCGVYYFFWDYSVQTRLKSNGRRYDVEIPEAGSTVVLWETLGASLFFAGPLIGQHIMYQSTNKLAYAYNQGRGNGAHNAQNSYGSQGGYIGQDQFAGYIPPAQNNPFEGQNAQNPFAGENGANAVDSNPFGGQPSGNNPFDATDNYNKYADVKAQKPVQNNIPQPNPKPQMAPQSSASGVVQCIKGPIMGQGFKLPAGSVIVIGKSTSKANMLINESHVSNVHCSIRFNPADNSYTVTDHSTNGTFINGQRLKKEVAVSVKAGTILSIVNNNIQIKLG